MKRLGMISGEIELPQKQILITKRRFLHANQAGFWVAETKPGTILRKGQTIGRLIDLFSEVEVIIAKEDAFLIQARLNPVVHSGDRVAFLGLEWRPF